jgi:uncharacterized membrane protein
MNMRAMVCLLGALVTLSASAEAQQALYRLTDLDVLPGKQSSEPQGVNSLGVVVGASYDPSTGWSPFRWSAATGIQPLATPATLSPGEAYGINDLGQICGYIGTTTENNRAIRWEADGSFIVLDNRSSGARSINSRGEVVGKFVTIGPPPSPGGPITGPTASYYPVRWDPLTGPQTLPGSPGNSQGEAESINDHGEIVGQIAFGARTHAALWDSQGVLTDLGALSSNDFAFAYGNNNVGQVVGSSSNFPFIWTKDSGMRPLEKLSDVLSSAALSINDQGLAVGYDATLWDATGRAHNLNTLLDSTGAGWTLKIAQAIGNGGHIVATGVSPQGAIRAVLLTPVPEPNCSVLILLGAVVFPHIGRCLKRERESRFIRLA